MDWWVDLFIHGILAFVAGLGLYRATMAERELRFQRNYFFECDRRTLDLIDMLNERITREGKGSDDAGR